MGQQKSAAWAWLWGTYFAGILAAILVTAGAATTLERRADPETLRIGSSGSLSAGTDKGKEKAAIESLESFIKDETDMKNDIIKARDWRDLAERMEKGDFHLGVFQGYEFAWAREQNPRLKPLALAVNVHRYPVAHVVTKKTSKAAGLSDLQGQSAALAASSPGYLRLFVEKQTGKKLKD